MKTILILALLSMQCFAQEINPPLSAKEITAETATGQTCRIKGKVSRITADGIDSKQRPNDYMIITLDGLKCRCKKPTFWKNRPVADKLGSDLAGKSSGIEAEYKGKELTLEGVLIRKGNAPYLKDAEIKFSGW